MTILLTSAPADPPRAPPRRAACYPATPYYRLHLGGRSYPVADVAAATLRPRDLVLVRVDLARRTEVDAVQLITVPETDFGVLPWETWLVWYITDTSAPEVTFGLVDPNGRFYPRAMRDVPSDAAVNVPATGAYGRS